MLAPGMRIGFGRPGGYILEGVEAPQAHAVSLVAGPPIAAKNGLLVLPALTDPEITVYRHRDGWSLEMDGEARAVEDGDVVKTRGGHWRLHLPEPLTPTYDGSERAGLALRFAVHRNEEYVELLAHVGEHRAVDLQARAHHCTLLHLARIRLAEQHLPPEQQGWIHQDDLLAQLGIDPGQLHLSIHRIRRQFAEVGLLDEANVIERRRGTRQLRIGIAKLEIVPIDRSPR